MKKTLKGFTLIELLIVIGILSVMAAVLLLAINPAEAQRKARDTQRLKDLSDLQTTVEQYIADNAGNITAVVGVRSDPAKRSCGVTGWLTKDVCNYIKSLPADPFDSRVGNYVLPNGTIANGTFDYKVAIAASGDYAISAHLEAKTNAVKIANDGMSDSFYSVYNNTAMVASSTW